MKKIFVLVVFLLLGQMTAWSIDLKYDGKSEISILELVFSEGAKANEAYISWKLEGDWDKLTYRFSQGIVKDGVLTIKASEYLDCVDKIDGIGLILEGKPKTRTGNYELSMVVNEVSKDLEFMKDDLELDIPVNYTGKPLWLRLLVPAIILIVLTLIILLVLHVTAKFPKGLLQLGRDEVDLKGKKRVSLKEELDKLGVELESGTDVVFIKKRFGSYQGPCVKEMKNCVLEREGVYLSKGAVILPDEEIHGLTDIQGNEILIRYC